MEQGKSSNLSSIREKGVYYYLKSKEGRFCCYSRPKGRKGLFRGRKKWSWKKGRVLTAGSKISRLPINDRREEGEKISKTDVKEKGQRGRKESPNGPGKGKEKKNLDRLWCLWVGALC